MSKETVIVLDFGGQYNQLIARRVRECNVYCEILPYTVDLETLRSKQPKGIIFTGGPNSVYDESSPHYDPAGKLPSNRERRVAGPATPSGFRPSTVSAATKGGITSTSQPRAHSSRMMLRLVP